MNHDRFNSRVNAAFVGNVAECYQTVQYVRVVSNQAWGVEEYADLTVAYYAAAFTAFAQNRSGNNVARLQFVNETFAQTVDQLGACGAHGFGNQRACQVWRVGNAGRGVLERIDIAQFGADTVSHYQAVCSRTKMVGSGETLQMQASAAAGCQYYALA